MTGQSASRDRLGAQRRNGVILLAKSAGKTSFASLALIKRALNTKRIGHTGTLDSFADGLLIALCGDLTKLSAHITALDKEYLAAIRFGAETDTLDPTGAVIREAPPPDRGALASCLPRFIGEIVQYPPAYSAVHIGGKRASEYARNGAAPQIPARKVRITSIELISCDADSADRVERAIIRVACSKGTYIRSLARDIGAACNSAAYTSALRRTRIGGFCLNEAVFADNLPAFSWESAGADFGENAETAARGALRSFSPRLAQRAGLTPVVIKDRHISDFSHGRRLRRDYFEYFSPNADAPGSEFAVFGGADEFLGVVGYAGGVFNYAFVSGARA